MQKYRRITGEMLRNFGGFPLSPARPYLMLHDASCDKDKQVKEVSRELRSAANINNRAGVVFRNSNNTNNWTGFKEVDNGRSSRLSDARFWSEI